MIVVDNITKKFRLTKKQMKKKNLSLPEFYAVDGISFKVKKGEIFGLIGPNGAGKTTTMRCISTLIKQTSGSIVINGFDTIKNEIEVKKNIAFLTNEMKIDGHFTPNYFAGFVGRMHNIPEHRLEQRKEELFKRFGIDNFSDAKISTLSTGMMQKVAIVVSIMHDPDVIIFDEPTNGLDILTAKVVTDYLLELKDRGKTIIISTHMMHTAEKLCDTYAMLFDKKVRIVGSRDFVLNETSSNNLEDAFFKLYYKYNDEEADV
ncbi:MAG: ABC transporter ATP-binding protein [Clostridiales bacterium]|nr:MAG: ABC transporter ATP-binding protein [Clostridiales bacterium]